MTRVRKGAVVLAQSLWLPVLLVAIWQAAASNGWLNPFFFPAPTTVLATGWHMTLTGELPRELTHTFGRYAQGVTLGCLGGIVCGALMGVSVAARRALEPIVAALYSTPKLTLLPLLMLLVGIGDESRVILIALVGFIFLSMQTLDGVRGVDPRYVEMARNYRAGRWAVIRRIYLPAALPQIFTGFRIALTRSMVTAIALELVAGENGIGAVIWLAWETLATERLYVGILVAAAIGIVVHKALFRLEERLIPWRRISTQ